MHCNFRQPHSQPPLSPPFTWEKPGSQDLRPLIWCAPSGSRWVTSGVWLGEEGAVGPIAPRQRTGTHTHAQTHTDSSRHTHRLTRMHACTWLCAYYDMKTHVYNTYAKHAITQYSHSPIPIATMFCKCEQWQELIRAADKNRYELQAVCSVHLEAKIDTVKENTSYPFIQLSVFIKITDLKFSLKWKNCQIISEGITKKGKWETHAKMKE